MSEPATYPSPPIAIANADDQARFYLYRPNELLVANHSEPLLTDRLKGIAELTDVIPELEVVRFRFLQDVDVPAFIDELLTEDESLQVGPNHVFWISEEEEEEAEGELGGSIKVPGFGLIGGVIDIRPVSVPTPDPALSGIRVSLIDTEIVYHPVFQSLGFSSFASGSSSGDPSRPQPQNHATSVAGVVLLGAPGIQLTALPVVDRGGLADELQIGQAIVGAIGVADLICVPLGGTSYRDRTPVSLASIPTIDTTVVIAAAGNHRSERPFWPAAIQWIVGVGAVDKDGRVVPWSGRGGWVDLYERGLAVPAPGPDRRWIQASGTSVAAAAATARLARTMAEHSLRPGEALARIIDQAAEEKPTLPKPKITTPTRGADPAISSDDEPIGPEGALVSGSPALSAVQIGAPEVKEAQTRPTPALPDDATPTAEHAGSLAAQRAGYASDTVPSDLEDRLDMVQEVEAISWVIAATDVDPPLSVGLFGDWGTGKSYFMRLMERCVAQIAATARHEHEADQDFPACSYVRQITFNAWHYVDANLWPSLVTHIFEELAKPDPETPQAEQEVANLLERLQTTQVLRQEAEDKKKAAGEERRRRTSELEQVKRRRMAQVRDLRRGQVDRKDLLLDQDIRDRATTLAKQTPATARRHAQETTAANLPDYMAKIANDQSYLREFVELIPDEDEETRSKLLVCVDDDAVRAGLSTLAADQKKVEQLAQLAGDPQLREKAIALIPGEQRQEVADLATQVTEIYTNVIALQQVAADVRTTWGKLGYSWEALRDWKPWKQKRFVIAAIILAVGIGLSAFLITSQGWTLKGILPVVASVGTYLGVAVPLIRNLVSRVKTTVDLAADAMDDSARRQIASLEVQEAQIQREIDEARRLELEAERELEDIRRGRRLYQYIQERASSTDYQQYLGVIALIRKDFERLAELMDEGRRAREGKVKDRAGEAGSEVEAAGNVEADGEEQSSDSLPQIDRIILYIDDLDRCPVKRVVEVLEAVHLLLALKLFVVVVGVDSRWLVRSLQRHYQAQLSSDEGIVPQRQDDLAYWDTTPQNYLEKIFQIVFSIRSMGRIGYESLLDALFPDTRLSSVNVEESTGSLDHAHQDAQATPVLDPEGIQPLLAAEGADLAKPANDALTDLADPLAAPEETRSTPTHPKAVTVSAAEARTLPLAPHAVAAVGDQEADTGSLTTAQTVEPEEQKNAEGGTAAHGLHPKQLATPPREALQITSQELHFMKRLVRFVPTPRSAKRLANTYRLMRVLVTADEAASFRPGHDGTGDYKIALTLLAILVGFPNHAPLMFRQLLEADSTNWPAFRARLAAERAETNSIDADGEAEPKRSEKNDGLESPSRRTDRYAREEPDADEPEVWERLLQYLEMLTKDAELPTELGPYQYWCRRVARYSFQDRDGWRQSAGWRIKRTATGNEHVAGKDRPAKLCGMRFHHCPK